MLMVQNYYIPAVMFAVEEDAEGNQTRICIDGKQRCTTVRAFFEGEIPFISPYTREKYWYHKYGQQKRGMQLPQALKTQFERFRLQAVEYTGISDMKQRDLFREPTPFATSPSCC